MTALVIYDGATHDIARYVKPAGEKMVRTHDGYVNDAFIGTSRSLQEFLLWPPEALRNAAEPDDPWKPRQDALRFMEVYNAAHLGDV